MHRYLGIYLFLFIFFLFCDGGWFGIVVLVISYLVGTWIIDSRRADSGANYKEIHGRNQEHKS